MQSTGYHIIKVAPLGVKYICGIQEYKTYKKYRVSTFTIHTSVVTGELFYSAITGEVILVTNYQSAYKYLITNWFLVEESFNEKEFVLKVKRLMKAIYNSKKNGYKTFEIVTSTQCNARCYYCYESQFERISMSDYTANHVIDFIKKHKINDTIRLKWYGGEPLMNMRVINHISTALINDEIQFYSTMISNGFLFNERVIEQANNLWHLQNVIITLDGTKDIYNKTKNYVYSSINAFDRVLSNIDNLIRHKIHVTIRFNIESNNISDISSLIDILCDRYKGNRLVMFMLRPLNNTENDKTIESSNEERSVILDKMVELRDRIFQAGFDIECGKLSGITGNTCIADSGKYILIKPNGELAYCSIDFDKKNCGNICSNNKDIQYPDFDSYRIPKGPICDDCPLYPQCSPSSICPACVKTFCNVRQKEYNIAEKIFLMKMLYRRNNEA